MKILRTAGFTLIELLVVITIIGILATVVLASLSDSRDQAHIASAQTQLRNIHTAMELLYNDTGLYPHKRNRYCPPTTAAGNEINLSTAAAGLVVTDGTYVGWGGPYIRNVVDPWGNPYFFDEDYQCTAGAKGCGGVADSGLDSSVLVSCGPDGLIGQDPFNGTQNNGIGCAYNDDNIVYRFCRS